MSSLRRSFEYESFLAEYGISNSVDHGFSADAEIDINKMNRITCKNSLINAGVLYFSQN